MKFTLAALKGLHRLNLNSTRLSPETFEKLKAALPALQECDVRLASRLNSFLQGTLVLPKKYSIQNSKELCEKRSGVTLPPNANNIQLGAKYLPPDSRVESYSSHCNNDENIVLNG
ncbi:hypothetical protein J437_LFUL016511 [Ladona fulva]|uniref:Uncharacterized protein n=1 Tax=Ladona fulva TaxID=123851 RepID=A0A8K0KS62_LADFU|nr:hypothetical protein J437_LFUL016511 [Ladona fulva]